MDLGGAVRNEYNDRARVNFVVDDSRLLLDAQEAKKHTVVR